MVTPRARPTLKPVGSTDPRPARSRALILDAALHHFLAHGYLASTVDGIAADAGVAKRTIYNLFPAKDALFRAVIERATETSERFVSEEVDVEMGIRAVQDEIIAFAVTHARTVLTPRVIMTRKLLIGESRRFPELAADYFDRVPSAVLQAIATRLERYDSLGLLAIADGRTAAEHFAYLVLGATLDRALFESGAPDPESIDHAAQAGAETFLRAYRTTPE